jgi:RNA polymerase sigma-70 factor, ECF subfamily
VKLALNPFAFSFERGTFSPLAALQLVKTGANPIPNSAMTDAAQPATQTDEQLMLAFSHGNTVAFDELFLRYRQPIFAFFRRRTPDLPRAEELSQETFIALLRSASRYQPRALFRTYLFAIAFGILRADRRKTAFRSFFFRSNANIHLVGGAEKNNDEILWLRQALARLDPTDREILLLREFEQLSYVEIADLLKLPLNTVRSRLFRARLALREHLEPSPGANSVPLGELS